MKLVGKIQKAERKELTREEFSKLVQREVIRELKEIWGPDTVDRALKESAASFSSDTDIWFDKIADLYSSEVSSPMLKLAQFVAKAPPTEHSIKTVHNAIRILGTDSSKDVRDQAEKVLQNAYSPEFKKQYGPTSQASEFLSMLRQAMYYNMK